MKYILALSLFAIAACASKPSAVNPDPGAPIVLFSQTPNETLSEEGRATQRATEDYMKRAPTAALSGHVVLGDDNGLPRPLSRISLRLSMEVDGKWKVISDMNTETDGSFRVTQKLYPGSYRLMSLDKRYKGEVSFALEFRPRENLILSLHEITM